jgi:hypothetical protein
MAMDNLSFQAPRRKQEYHFEVGKPHIKTCTPRRAAMPHFTNLEGFVSQIIREFSGHNHGQSSVSGF